ncbi:MAG: alpha-D-ribose 1-methylphosphonate 5-triphosphate diphosphatase [Deltaproteobacteria bacterium]|jgi:alpha-D-ribose 1-methylphosphonate 5-triphosphate diphosphatase|nr:alpha-D-ribose 1-methylphosphonate 5-triphosphate diphosphatase [Deltaproteobacteria bacterium]
MITLERNDTKLDDYWSNRPVDRRQLSRTAGQYLADGLSGGKISETTILAGATVLTPDGPKKGHLAMANGVIINIGNGLVPNNSVNIEGDWLVPGLVELHTDNLEKHLLPRPGIYWPEPGAAVEAHDAQLIGAGITTVFDSICVGESVDRGRHVLLQMSLDALQETESYLRADHRLHLRCEISDPEMGELFDQVCHHPKIGLISLMDHTPGQRQWRDIQSYRQYYQQKCSDQELALLSERVKANRDRFAQFHSEKIARHTKINHIPLASHDDTLVEHVQWASENGVTISEFPTTLQAAQAAASCGLAVTMGAPNLVRGQSHSGNVTTKEVAEAGLLSSLSSDYVPSSLLSGVTLLYRDCGFSWWEAFKTVTASPAQLAKLPDRGCLVPGYKADVLRVSLNGPRPVIRSVWISGQRVF